MAILDSSGLLARPGRVHGWLRGISLATVIATFALVVLGGVVRVTGSGLGCPDWPLCHGNVVPPLELKAIIEYTHRFIASVIVGPLVAATAAVVWFSFRRERWLIIPATLALFLLAAQALLGGVTVLSELPGEIVAAHLALGEALLACLVLIAVVAYRGPLTLHPRSPQGSTDNDRFPVLAALSAIGVYVLLLSGSLVTATGALAGCLDWPLCQGAVFPEGRLAAIHMGHRYVAAIIGILLIFTLHLAIKDRSRPAELRTLAMVAIALFVAQVGVGAATILTRFPPELMATHQALATAVWASVVAVAVVSFTRQRVYFREPAYD